LIMQWMWKQWEHWPHTETHKQALDYAVDVEAVGTLAPH
jgi:hypothetical protein